jgi:surface carbohydrate biosynthesis protein (TIGR04326 family)
MKNLVILDLETQKKFDNSYTILWNSFSKKKGDGNFSINNLIEKKEQHYREKILNLISSFKNVSLNNKKIEDILKIDNKLSFWWFSKINEKCNETKTTELNEIVKIYALEDFIKKKKIKNIKIFSKNSNLIEYLKVYSKKNKLNLNYSVLNKKYYINFCFFINGIMAIIYSFFKYILLTEKN